MTRAQRVIESPLGPILLSADASGRLTGVGLGAEPDMPGTGEARVLERAADQLAEYFDGRRRCFDVPVVMKGTAFQHQVWEELQQIPFGSTVTYGQLASWLGRPGAARAVGRANATNPIAVIVPCHRVIGSSGELTGYGGGLEAKQRLLDLEAGVPLRVSGPRFPPVRASRARGPAPM